MCAIPFASPWPGPTGSGLGSTGPRWQVRTKRGTSMGILTWIILGLIAGAIAKFIMPGRDPGGIFVTIIIGIVGAIIGGFISTQLGYGDVSGFNFPSVIIAVIGAIILLVIYRMVASRRGTV